MDDVTNRRPPRLGEPMMKREEQHSRKLDDDLDELLKNMDVKVERLSNGVEELSRATDAATAGERRRWRWQMLFGAASIILSCSLVVGIWASRQGHLPDSTPGLIRLFFEIAGEA